ncbi:TonB-dependent receptor [Chitinophaga sp. Cy-1792]|uniref:TonB-dependent receptor n=1 Tax=Chitinophaga sp. Cy-1792 TaxID=2608339 RepID=UPI001420E011|nr:TonB-dependent receptor [Chitinophaga sp. Cy-1792]NIG55648.1 TonB-dependent receptor [Chitinophaga sp. Cy-1792]
MKLQDVTRSIPWRRRVFNTFIAMKLTAGLLIASCLQVSAYSYGQTVTLHEKKISLQKLFLKIHEQTGYQVFYKDWLLDNAGKVDINVDNMRLEQVLAICFKDLPLSYTVSDKNIVIRAKQATDNKLPGIDQQTPVIRKGIVKDEKGLPLVGVTVSVSGTSKGTITNEKGEFSIAADRGDVLLFSILGYKKKSITLADNSVISISLDLDIVSAGEVVVVGYGTQKKVNLTGAVSSIKGSDLDRRPVLNATQSLEGLVPGLNVSVGSSTKPGQSYNLNVRGAGNLAGGDGPLVLVDGIPMDLGSVNPNDIESISVLKDAAASAIYGARAPYGVILVTTKKGKADKTVISYSNNFGLTRPVNLPEMANAYDFAVYFNAACANAGVALQYSDAKLAQLKAFVENPNANVNPWPEAKDNYLLNFENTPNGVASTDWFAFNYKPSSFRQQHNLSVSGGNKTTQYFVSGGYYGEGGVLRFADINYNRYNLNSTITSQVTDWFKLKLNSKVTADKYTAPFSPGGTFEQNYFHDLARFRPNVSPYDLNGHYNELSLVPYLQSGSSYSNKIFTLIVQPGIELEPIKNWKITADLNINRGNTDNTTLLLPGVQYGIDGTQRYVNRSEFGIPIGGSYARGLATNLYLSPNIYTSYRYTPSRDHEFNFLAGFQQEAYDFTSLSSAATPLISFNTPGINLSGVPATTSESRYHWSTRGFFGRINYNYKEKYLVEFNGRYDGSSRFAPSSRWGFFPSGSVGYNIVKEDFMEGLHKVFDNLKIRASYGLLGNQSGAGMYSYIQTMGISNVGINGAGPQWYFQNGREANIYAPAAYNPGVTWEKVQVKNLGIDFDLLQSRLSGTFEVYQRDTKDMLGPSFDIADMFGAAVPSSNNANLRTSGWELTLNYKGNISSDVKFSVGAVLSDNKSVVTKYQNPTGFNPSVTFYNGKQLGEIWGYRASGLIQNDEEAAAFNAMDHSFISTQPWKPGDVRYIDLNGDKKINNGANRLDSMGDMTIIGNASPRYAYAFTGTIDWKGLTLSFVVQGIAKRDYAPTSNDVYFWGYSSYAQVTVFKQHLDYWTPENPNAYYPAPYTNTGGAVGPFQYKSQQVSDRYLQNAAYLRLKNVTLNYSLPARLISKAHLSKVSVFMSGENLLTFTKLSKMFDPETLNISAVGTGKSYPLTQVYSAGMNVIF